MVHLGTDENTLIKITVQHNNYQRQKIKTAYQTMYKKASHLFQLIKISG